MSRHTHLVGAWPGKEAPDAIETALTRVGPHLERMTDGETGLRAFWVTPTIVATPNNPDVNQLDVKATGSYSTQGFYELKVDGEINPDNIEHPYFEAFEKSYPIFKELRDKHDQPQISFQVGIPAPLDYAVIIFGLDYSASHPEIEDAYTASAVREITQIHEQGGDDVIFQIETVNGLVHILEAAPPEQQAVADRVADNVHKLVAATPEGTRFGAHLCLGDFNHEAMGEMNDATPVVLLSNALAKNFPDGRTLEYIHVPFAAAEKPSSMDESWYRPLENLDIPEDVTLIAGFIHEDVSPADHKKLLELIEGFAGRQVDVAASCGLGRRPDPEQAWDAMDKAIALVDA